MKRRTGRGTIRAEAGTIFAETLAAVSPAERSNATPLARQAGKVLLACDQCGTQFWRKSSHAGGRNYCGQGCSQAAQRKRVRCACVVCGGDYLIWPSAAEKPRTTCGKPACIHARQQEVAKGRSRDARRVFVPAGAPR